MAEKNPDVPIDQSQLLSDSDTSDEEVDPRFKTSLEERHYGTITGLAIATRAALSHSTAQCNPTVEQGLQSRKTMIKKFPSQKATDKTTQTNKTDKETR